MEYENVGIHEILKSIQFVCQQTNNTDEQKKDAIELIVQENINTLVESPIEGMALNRYKIYNNDIVQSYLVLIDQERLLDESIYDKIQTEYIPLKHNDIPNERGFHLLETELLSTDFGLFMEKWRELESTRKSPYFFLANLANMGRTLRCYKKKCTLNEPKLKTNNITDTVFYNNTYGDNVFNKDTYVTKLNTNSNDVDKLFTLWNECLSEFDYDKYVDLYLEYFKYYIKINPNYNKNDLNYNLNQLKKLHHLLNLLKYQLDLQIKNLILLFDKLPV